MNRVLILLFFYSNLFCFSQTDNSNEILSKNKVKKCFETHCFKGSNSSCTAFNYEFDPRGNTILWNTTRLGSYYRYEYNEKNLLIREYTISGKDKIDTLCYHYDNYDNLDLETRMYNDYENEDQHKKIYDTIRYNNVYDSQNRLI